MTNRFKIVPTLSSYLRPNPLVGGLLFLAVGAPLYAQNPVELKIRNTAVGPATFEIKSVRSLTPENPWRTVTVSPNRTQTLQIASPDDYIVRARADGVRYESTAIPLKEWVNKNPKFELTLSRMAAAPPGMVAPVGLGLRFDPPLDDPQPGAGEQIEFKPLGGDRPLRRILQGRFGNGGPGNGGPGNFGAAAPR